MTFQQKMDYIHSNPEIYLQRDGSGRGWICPICGSGSGSHGTGMTESKKFPGHFKCWACDGFGKDGYGDVVDMVKAEYNLNNSDAFRKAFEIYGVLGK